MRARAAALVLLLAACSEEAPSTLEPRGDEASRLAGVWWLMFGLAIAVYVVVAGFILVGALRGRGTEEGRPSRLREDRMILLGGVVAPAVVLLVLAVVTVSATADLRQPEDEALEVHVDGAKWWWEVRYPDEAIVTANEVHVPVGRQVELHLTSRDVIHSFWVPEVAGKMDLVPGQRNVLRFTVDEPGEYTGICAEYCGLQHARMLFVLVAEEPGDFERWVARHEVAPGLPDSEEVARGRMVFERESCAGCHTVNGTTAQGTVGPDLSDFGMRRTIAAGTVPNEPDVLSQWIVDPGSIKPGALMPPSTLSSTDLRALVAYLESLP